MKTVAISEIARPGGLVGGPFGSSLVSADYVDDGVPVIRGGNMADGGVIAGPYAYVTPEKFASDLRRNSAQPGDLIFTQRGTLGQVAVVPEGRYGTYVVSQSQMRLRVDSDSYDGRFVYFACSTAQFNRQIGENAIATGVPHINLGVLGKLRIPSLPLFEQRAIAEVLGALDDKIAANRNVILLSDELAELTFRAAIRDGEALPLSSLARFVNGKAFTKGATGTGRVVIRIAELNSGLGNSTVRNDIDVADDHVARPGDLLFAWSGSLTVARWFRDDAIVNQHIFKVIPDGHPLWLVNQAVRSKLRDYQGIAADKATTMGHIQRKHLDEPVRIPEAETVRRLDARMSALWQRALAAEIENEQLTKTRDGLLPLLMSGKLRVKDAAKHVEEVV